MPKYRTLTDSQRIQALSLLQGAIKDGWLPHGELTKVAKIFGVSRQAIHVLWKNFGGTDGQPINRSPTNMKRCPKPGRPSRYNREDMRQHVCTIPLRERKTVRSLASALDIPKSTLHDMMRNGGFWAHTSALKPELTEANKYDRVMYALSKVDETTKLFKDMEDEIHVDEKWFYLTRDNKRYYLLDDEPDPHRSVGHKSHIDKVMFLAATARPRWDPNLKQMWEGKIGMWPFAWLEPAQRSSVNRPAGTL
jgi:hypothetical protein